MTTHRKWRAVGGFLRLSLVLAVLAAVLPSAAQPSATQPLTEHTIELDGQAMRYAIRAFPPDTRAAEATTTLEPVSAINTAMLLDRLLTVGLIEDAALLSNAPRRRFEVLRDYEAAVGADGFKQVFIQYFRPENRLIAEIVMDRHSLLVWHLSRDNRYAGQYYVRVEAKVLMDDVPSENRARLRRLLEAIRSGKMQLPTQ